jgi:hypothetical protein
MENIGKSHPDTLIRLGRPEDFEAFVPTRIKTQNLADRIAAGLDERRRIGEERRRREREYLLPKTERTQAWARKRSGPKGSDCRVRELNALCEAVSSSNAAIEAMKEHGTVDAY